MDPSKYSAISHRGLPYANPISPSKMEGSGLLTRRSDPRDNRFTLVTLTPTGHQIAQQMTDFTHTLEAQLLEVLSEEMIATIRQGLEQIQERYEHLKEGASPIDPLADRKTLE